MRRLLDYFAYGTIRRNLEYIGHFINGTFRRFFMGSFYFCEKQREKRQRNSVSPFFNNGDGRCVYVDDIKKSRLKGSYTVEMALISGVWLLVIFASLFLIWGTQTKVWKTAQICELSVYGSGRSVISEETAVKETKQKAADMQESYTVSGGKKEISVGFQKEFYIPFQNLNWSMKEKWKSKVIKPVDFIEKVQKYRRFSQNIE